MTKKIIDHSTISESTSKKLNIPVKQVDDTVSTYGESIIEEINKNKENYETVEVLTPIVALRVEKQKKVSVDGIEYPDSYAIDAGLNLEMFEKINEHLSIQEKSSDSIEDVKEKKSKVS